jgi:16S rRNA (guanine527-N7)-methyltransferase
MMATGRHLGMIDLDVSRETIEKLEQFLALIKKWNTAINLVSKPSLAMAWDRHILDSAQIFSVTPESAIHFVDIGSGGGLPGIVLAVLSEELAPDRRFTLVESDQRKAAFLREASRALCLNLTVLSERAESISPLGAEVLSARAFAPLSQLLGTAQRHLLPDGCCLFPKGESYMDEIDAAKKEWTFEYEAITSKTDPRGAILKIYGIQHV